MNPGRGIERGAPELASGASETTKPRVLAKHNNTRLAWRTMGSWSGGRLCSFPNSSQTSNAVNCSEKNGEGWNVKLSGEWPPSTKVRIWERRISTAKSQACLAQVTEAEKSRITTWGAEKLGGASDRKQGCS